MDKCQNKWMPHFSSLVEIKSSQNPKCTRAGDSPPSICQDMKKGRNGQYRPLVVTVGMTTPKPGLAALGSQLEAGNGSTEQTDAVPKRRLPQRLGDSAWQLQSTRHWSHCSIAPQRTHSWLRAVGGCLRRAARDVGDRCPPFWTTNPKACHVGKWARCLTFSSLWSSTPSRKHPEASTRTTSMLQI